MIRQNRRGKRFRNYTGDKHMNRVCLVATKFTDIATARAETYGFRLYDDHGQNYDNTAESPITDDLELLKWALEMHPIKEDSDMSDCLNEVAVNKKGMEINGQWYDWDEIKHLFEQV